MTQTALGTRAPVGATRTALAVDAGQTGMKARLTGSDGSVASFRFDGIRTDLALAPQLAAVIAEVAHRGGTPIEVVSFGVSGLTSDESDPAALLAAGAGSGVAEVHLAHDSVTAYLGALGDDRGVVVAAGTGVVTLAVGDSSVARVDGWGYLIGDAGSGYWVGRAALDAVMRAHDGRGPATALTDVVRADFPDLEAAYIELQSDQGRVRRIASYARRVAALADDPVASGILTQAGAELARAAVTGLRRVGEGSAVAPRVRGVGGLFESSAVALSFTRAVRAELEDADVRPAPAHPLDGAALLPQLSAHSPLRDLVAVARR